MPIPESAAGQILDVRRQLAFRSEVEITTLVLYNQAGSSIKRLDHWWHLGRSRRDGRTMTQSQRLEIMEDGESLDTVMAAVKTVRYEIPSGATPVPLSDTYEVALAERPEAGRNRLWVLRATKPEYKGKHFRTGR
jgi:hypothetical protein